MAHVLPTTSTSGEDYDENMFMEEDDDSSIVASIEDGTSGITKQRQSATVRRRNKQRMERERRARIKQHLQQLKELALSYKGLDPAAYEKMEVSDILRTTVELTTSLLSQQKQQQKDIPHDAVQCQSHPRVATQSQPLSPGGQRVYCSSTARSSSRVLQSQPGANLENLHRPVPIMAAPRAYISPPYLPLGQENLPPYLQTCYMSSGLPPSSYYPSGRLGYPTVEKLEKSNATPRVQIAGLRAHQENVLFVPSPSLQPPTIPSYHATYRTSMDMTGSGCHSKEMIAPQQEYPVSVPSIIAIRQQSDNVQTNSSTRVAEVDQLWQPWR